MLDSILTLKRHTGPRDQSCDDASTIQFETFAADGKVFNRLLDSILTLKRANVTQVLVIDRDDVTFGADMATPVAENTEYLQSSIAAREALERIAWKKEILKAKKLFEATAQVPSPSKDFVNVVITEKGVVWRKWKITIRGVTQGAAPVPLPSEEAMTHEDFQYAMEDEVERIFGPEVLRQMQRIISGSRDELSKLPEQTMLDIATNLDLQSIARLSQVNRHLREVCNSDSLWGQLYRIHQGAPSGEVVTLATDASWKKSSS